MAYWYRCSVVASNYKYSYFRLYFFSMLISHKNNAFYKAKIQPTLIPLTASGMSSFFGNYNISEILY